MCQVKYVICPDINEQVNPGSKIWLPNVQSILKPYCEHWVAAPFSFKTLRSGRVLGITTAMLANLHPQIAVMHSHM